jgi:MFS family permease
MMTWPSAASVSSICPKALHRQTLLSNQSTRIAHFLALFFLAYLMGNTMDPFLRRRRFSIFPLVLLGFALAGFASSTSMAAARKIRPCAEPHVSGPGKLTIIRLGSGLFVWCWFTVSIVSWELTDSIRTIHTLVHGNLSFWLGCLGNG